MKITINRSMSIGLLLAGVMVLVALFAPWLAPNDPYQANLDERLVSPTLTATSEYPLGTDHLGRCILSRALFATRISLIIGISVISLSLFTGTVIGAVSGYVGGVVDEVIMRVVDAFLSFPGMFVALAVAGIFGGSIIGLVVALALVEWTVFARISRGSVISVKNMDFVLASRSMGAGNLHILRYHILPNITSPLLVIATLGMGYVILAAASLSFLGLGISSYPELGMMVNDGRYFLQSAPHVMFVPGMFIVSIVLGFNFIGDGLRDIFDPKDTKQRWRVF
ncbi:ABC transporter permease [Methanosalsum natronophilum]|uniref:ABC transporter permease n=1 Tax=Methanosalsum natronophilum TaxID=768733 RepID=UPI00216A97D0|nr:ABC transporter permease [Methanosalsum natronophilum]MCS3923398.1 peptide/nickel transport system permease protein [Methanosalsum natronophilum]